MHFLDIIIRVILTGGLAFITLFFIGMGIYEIVKYKKNKKGTIAE